MPSAPSDVPSAPSDIEVIDPDIYIDLNRPKPPRVVSGRRGGCPEGSARRRFGGRRAFGRGEGFAIDDPSTRR